MFYQASFYGRVKGSIEIRTYPCSRSVMVDFPYDGPDAREAARVRLAETHERVNALTLIPLAPAYQGGSNNPGFSVG